jgi:hypothetical protein
MSVKSKIFGVLRSVFGIYRDGAAQYTGQQTGGLGTRIYGGGSTSYVEVGSAITLGASVTDVRADGFAQFTISNAKVTLGGAAGSATTFTPLIVKKTGIADNTATSVITVTVPNASHAAAIRVHAIGSSGGADAFESTATLVGNVVVARTTGANAVVTAAAATLTGTATVAAGAALTSFAYGVSAVSGAAGASNTFDIQVTINDSGNLGSNQCVMLAEIINAESSGVTMAAA